MKVLVMGVVLFTAAVGQYPALLWEVDLLSQCYGSPAVGDIDGDGLPEVVFGTYFDDEHAYALNGEDGSALWRFDVGGGPLDAAPVIYDVNLDGVQEVIIPASWGILFCLSPEGEVVWRYPEAGYIECIDSPPAVADVDGDGLPEVVFGTWYGKVYVLNGEDGTPVWTGNYCDTGYVQSAPCIVDLDGDGQDDIVVAMFRGDHRVYSLRGSDGEVLWTFTADASMYAGASCGDIDGDGTREIVIGDYSGKVYALRTDGTLLWETPSMGYYIFAPTTVADIVPDSPGDEILCAPAQSSGAKIVCLSCEGEQLWDFPSPGEIDRGAVVAEVDGDPLPEVIFAGGSTMYVLNGEDGSLVWAYDLGDSFPVGNAPVVADLDGDGNVDIFCIGGRGYSDTIPNYGRAFAIAAGSGAGQMWTMYRHDRLRSGNFSGGFAGIKTARLPSGEIKIYAYPNPFNEECAVIAEGAEMLEICDLKGRVVCRSRNPGVFRWHPGRDVPSGIYRVVAYGNGGRAAVDLVYLR